MSGSESKIDVRTIALKIGAVVLSVILLLSTGLFLVELWEQNFSKTPTVPETLDKTLTYKGKTYRLKENVETFLVLGLDQIGSEDSGSYDNDKKADFLTLFVFDSEEQSCKAIQINRDTMAEMNVLGVAGDKIGTVTRQIALSHTYGNGKEVSCRNTANAVSKLLGGVKVDHYLSATMEAVPVYNDLLGGVTLEVLEDLTEIDEGLVKGQTVTLTGKQALYYVRSRYGLEDPSNSSRMKRQKQYVEALSEKTHELAQQDGGFVSSAVMKMADYLVSDCSLSKLETLLKRLSAYEPEGILQIDGENRIGEQFVEFYPDKDSITEAVIACFYEEQA